MPVFTPWRRSALRAMLLSCLILLPGTPSVVSAEQASESLAALAALAADSRLDSEEAQSRVGGAPPDEDELRRLGQTPPLSGANPPYPRNHVFDGNLEPVGTPPSNHGFETSPTSTGTPPSNADIETSPLVVGTEPTNHDFETGDLTGWTTSGTVTVDGDTPHGSYAKLSGTNATLISDAFAVDSAGQAFVFDAGWLTTSGYSWVKVYVLSGPSYTTQSEILSAYCQSCGTWERKTVDTAAYLGQSIKLKFVRSFGDVGIDDVQVEQLLPNLTPTGTYARLDDAGDHFVELKMNATLTTDAFSVASDAQVGAVQIMGRSTLGDQYLVQVLSGAGYATTTTVASGTVADSWTTVKFMLAEWQGQSIKLKLKAQYQHIGVDDIGVQGIELPGWEVGPDAELVRVDASGEHYVRLAWDALTTEAFTVDPAAQQVTFAYRAGSASSVFDVVLLHGTNYSQTTNLDTTVTTSDQVNWQTFTAAIDDWVGESVKLRIDQGFGWGEYDLVGLTESLLPGWSLGNQEPIEIGEDASGSYVTGMLANNGSGNFQLESSELSTGILDASVFAEQRYYAIAFEIGHRTGSLIRVTWYDAGSSQNWVVYQHAADDPTSYLVDYFWLADFMGTDGYFQVQVADNAGKLYSIADNIARVQLSEPFSEKVGYQLDTSTGSFGYQETDITTEGSFPLSFTRYYAGHSDHYGTMGFRWRHIYDIRLEITDDDDAGVIYGSGREVFFDEQNGSGLFEPADPRVHDELVLNQDGTYTYTTSTNLDYLFDAAGVLQSITDLNGNQITLSYNGSGQLTTITGLGNQVISLAYDGNGRLSTVTDPENEVWIYGYDANGDLITVTDPDIGEREYEYSRHRLIKAINPLDDVVFENVFDDWHRVIQQIDADQNVLTLVYDTPGVGATEVTDPENNTATYYFDQYQRTTHVVDPLGNTVVRIYDAEGNLEKLIDPGNDDWQFAYNATGDVTQLTDPLGNDIAVTYNTLHLPLSMTDGRGKTTTFTYDAAGNMLTRTAPLNHTWTYTYDSAGNRLTETNPLNQTTTWTYDSAGNKLTETNALNQTTTWTYDNAGRELTETNALNQTTTYTRNSRGYITRITDGLGNQHDYTWDLYGNLWDYDDPLDNSTVWNYDERALIVSKIDEANEVTSYTYDDKGQMLSMTDRLNNTTSWAYDDSGRLISETDPLNNTWTYAYDSAGRLASEIDPMNRTISYGYDDAGRLTSKTMPNGGVYSYAYDENGNLTSETDPMIRTTTYAYDDANQLVSKTDPLNNTWTYAYDAAGRLISETDPRNNTTTSGYDAAGRQTTLTDALSGVVQFAYDAAGNLTSVTNPNNQTTTFTYDALGNVLTETDPLNNTWTHTYNALGDMATSTDPRSVQVSYGYDVRGDLTSVTYPGGSLSYGYDDVGRRTTMTDPTGTTTWGYDAASQVTSVAAPNGTVGYAYNAAGQRSAMTLPGSRMVSYGYDTAGLLTSVTDWQSRAISFALNAAGQRTSITRPNGVSTSYTYDGAGRTASIVHSDTNGTLQSYGYTYDGAGNRASVTSGAGTESYTYDALNRLTNVTYPNTGTAAYTYDANGNRLSSVFNSQTLNSYTYNTADQMTSDGTTSYTYDAAGNQLTAGADSFTWDWAGRLASATISGTTTTYAYDGDGVRASATTGGVTTPYLWDRPGELPMLVDDGAKAYLHADGLLAEIDGSNAALYLLTDALGSVRGLTDGTGALTGTSSFDAFGTVRSSTGVTSRFGFTGEQLDSETGYTFLRARYLNTKHGRFISRDTVQPNADGSQGYNRYAYVANNPCTLTDPSGHEADCQSTLGAISWLALINVAVRGLLIGVSPVDKSGFAIFTYAALGAATIGFAEAFGNGLGWAEDIAASKGGRLGFAVFHLLAGEAGGVALLSFGIAFVAWGRSLLAAPVGLALIVAATLLFLTAISMEAMLAISNIRSRVIDKFCGSAGSVFSAFSSLGGFLGGESYGPGGRNSAFQGGSDSPASLYNVADTVPASPKIARPNAV